MHFCPVGERADAHNREEQYQCKIRITPPGRDWPRLHLTPGAMGAAGIALSLHHVKHYTERSLEHAPPYLDITMWTSNELIVVLLGVDEALARWRVSRLGAHHLEGLVNYIGAQMDETRQAGHRLAVLWAPRTSRGVGRADALARHGPSNRWPGRLLDLLMESSEVVYAADVDDRSVMMRF